MARFNNTLWREGALKVKNSSFHYWAKVYDECSEYGIDGGRVSKLMIKRGGEIVCNYDRCWDIKPVDEDTEFTLGILIKDYN